MPWGACTPERFCFLGQRGFDRYNRYMSVVWFFGCLFVSWLSADNKWEIIYMGKPCHRVFPKILPRYGAARKSSMERDVKQGVPFSFRCLLPSVFLFLMCSSVCSGPQTCGSRACACISLLPVQLQAQCRVSGLLQAARRELQAAQFQTTRHTWLSTSFKEPG